MKIASSTIAMQSQHYEMQRTEERQRLRVWVDRQPPAIPEPVSPAPVDGADKDAASGDYRVQLLKAMLEWLTGKPVKLFDPCELQSAMEATGDAPVPPESPRPAVRFVEYEYHASHREVEQTGFAAIGRVTTSDGREIDLALDVAMARSYSEQVDVSLRSGEGRRRKDPLVLNPLDGTAAQLSSQRMTFDLDADGKAEEVPLLSGGSAYLALDRNQNGKIDSGAELFGAATGAGFAELAAYDADGNNWIDENDPVFAQLRLWTPEAEGAGRLLSLSDKNVGALFLGNADTPFQLRNARNEDLGAVRTTGLYLTESGQAGSLQQIDLTV